MRFLTKKNIFIILELGSLLFGFVLRNLPPSLCVRPYEFGGELGCFDKFPIALSDLFLIFAPVMFILSLITYFLREEVFRTWIRFTYWWVPLSFVVVLFAGSRPSANIVGLSDQEIFGFLTWSLYVLISLVTIIWKYFGTRKRA